MQYINVKMKDKMTGYTRIEPVRAETEPDALEEAAEIFGNTCEDFDVEPAQST